MASRNSGSGKSSNRSGNRKPSASATRQKAAPKTGGSNGLWIGGAAAVAVFVIVAVLANGGGQAGRAGQAVQTGQAGQTGQATSAGQIPQPGSPQAPPEEQKYIGRFLPAGYQEPEVAQSNAYTSTVRMTNIAAKQDKDGVSVPAAQVVSNKIVYFEASRPGGEKLPMIAYVKPSGKLFVGISYCAPCKGKGQRIESDGTLTCESCGTKRDPETLVGLSGACRLYPLDELPSTLKSGKISVASSALARWTPQPLDRPTGG